MPEEFPLKRAPRVADSLTKNPDFIKVGFHIGRFITAVVDTAKQHVVTKALKINLEFALEEINVSISFLFQLPFSCHF
jgi:hypothetical protein